MCSQKLLPEGSVSRTEWHSGCRDLGNGGSESDQQDPKDSNCGRRCWWRWCFIYYYFLFL